MKTSRFSLLSLFAALLLGQGFIGASSAQAKDCAGLSCVGDKIVPWGDQDGYKFSDGSRCLTKQEIASCPVATITAIRFTPDTSWWSGSGYPHAITTLTCNRGLVLESACRPDLVYLAKGCTKFGTQPCIGEVAMSEYGPVTIVGLDRHLFETSPANDWTEGTVALVKGKKGERSAINLSSLWKTSGCYLGLACIGEDYLDLEDRIVVRLEKISLNAELEVRTIGGDDIHTETVEVHRLASMKGCDGDICVGQKVVTAGGRNAQVIALNLWIKDGSTQKFVLRFDDNGSIGKGWKRPDITPVAAAQGQKEIK